MNLKSCSIKTLKIMTFYTVYILWTCNKKHDNLLNEILRSKYQPYLFFLRSQKKKREQINLAYYFNIKILEIL